MAVESAEARRRQKKQARTCFSKWSPAPPKKRREKSAQKEKEVEGMEIDEAREGKDETLDTPEVKREGEVKQEPNADKEEDEMQAEGSASRTPASEAPQPLGEEIEEEGEGEDTADEVHEERPVPLRERMSRVQYALSFLVLPKTIADSLFQDEVLYIPLEQPRETSYPMSASGGATEEDELSAMYGAAMLVEGQQGYWQTRGDAGAYARSNGAVQQQQQQQQMAWASASGSRLAIQHSTASVGNPALSPANNTNSNNSSSASDVATSPSNLLRSNVFPTMNRPTKVMALVGPLSVDPRAVSFRLSTNGSTSSTASEGNGSSTGENPSNLAQ